MDKYFRYLNYKKFIKHWKLSGHLDFDDDDFTELGGILFWTRYASVLIPIAASLLFSYWLNPINSGVVHFIGYIKDFQNSPSLVHSIILGFIKYRIDIRTVIFVFTLILGAVMILIHMRLDDRMDSLRLKRIVELADRAPSHQVLRKIEQPIHDLTFEVERVKSKFKKVHKDELDKESIKKLDEEFTVFFRKQLKLLRSITMAYYKLERVPFRMTLMFFLEENAKEAINCIAKKIKKNSIIVYPQYSTKKRVGYFLNRGTLNSYTSERDKLKLPNDEDLDVAILFSSQNNLDESPGIHELWKKGFTYVPNTNILGDIYSGNGESRNTNKFFHEIYNNINSFASIRIDKYLNSDSALVVGALNIESAKMHFLGKDDLHHETHSAMMKLLLSISREISSDYQVFLTKHLLKAENSDILNL